MTLTDEGLDTDLESLLDFELDVPCDVSHKCGLAAKWYAMTACCGWTIVLCDEHKDAIIALMEKKVLTQCEKCESIGTFNILIHKIERL